MSPTFVTVYLFPLEPSTIHLSLTSSGLSLESLTPGTWIAYCESVSIVTCGGTSTHIPPIAQSLSPFFHNPGRIGISTGKVIAESPQYECLRCLSCPRPRALGAHANQAGAGGLESVGMGVLRSYQNYKHRQGAIKLSFRALSMSRSLWALLSAVSFTPQALRNVIVLNRPSASSCSFIAKLSAVSRRVWGSGIVFTTSAMS